MLSYDEAVALIRDLAPARRQERIPIASADGRVLAAPVAMDRDQPPFDRATMDGFAVVPDGERRTFPVIATVHAGEELAVPPARGEAVRIMTGAPCPPGVAVIPIERTEPGEGEVTLNEDVHPTAGQNVARRGEDAAAGQIVVAAGQRLDPVTLGAAAMAGATEVEVLTPLRAAVVTTGDEVGGEGAAAIADSNGPMLASLLRALGCEPSRHHARDVQGDMEGLFRSLAAEHEVIVTTGGVSMGDRDLVPASAAAAGFETIFHKVAMQPGKPVLLARRPADGHVLVGLPGNPVSVLATTQLVLAPVLRRLQGGAEPTWLELPLVIPWHHRGRRRLFLPARFAPGGIAPIRWNGSGDLLAAASGDGLVDLAPGSQLETGTLVRFLPYLGSQPGAHPELDRSPRS